MKVKQVQEDLKTKYNLPEIMKAFRLQEELSFQAAKLKKRNEE